MFGIDQTGASVESSVTVERGLTIYLNSQEIVTAMTINDYPEYLALGFLLNQNMLLPDDVVTGVDYDELRKVVESSVGAAKGAAATKRVSASGDLAVRKVLTYDAERVAADEVLVHLGGTKGDDGPSVTVIG